MSDATLWAIILSMGLGSFLLRFSFLGVVGNRPLPQWLLRHLRYTAVAILPAMVAPLIAFSNTAGTGPDPARLASAGVVIIVGYLRQSAISGILAGAAVLAVLTLILG